jgi:Ca2+-binding EF-hand superfamily protein
MGRRRAGLNVAGSRESVTVGIAMKASNILSTRKRWTIRSTAILGLALAVQALATTQELVDEDVQREYFETADYDKGGWISFREAEASMLLDREEFSRYDADGDGRIDSEEFAARYRLTVEQIGGFQPPIPDNTDTTAPPRGAEELRNTYDVDLNGSLDMNELGTLIADYQIPDLTAALAMNQLDRSGNGRLELIELEFVATLLDALRTASVNILPTTGATTLEGLFGVPIDRPERPGQVTRPPRIGGPIQPFARLDLDRDEAITVDDLTTLEFPMALPVRPATVIASLDTNGDGQLDRAEFRAAMGAAREDD